MASSARYFLIETSLVRAACRTFHIYLTQSLLAIQIGMFTQDESIFRVPSTRKTPTSSIKEAFFPLRRQGIIHWEFKDVGH